MVKKLLTISLMLLLPAPAVFAGGKMQENKDKNQPIDADSLSRSNALCWNAFPGAPRHRIDAWKQTPPFTPTVMSKEYQQRTQSARIPNKSGQRRALERDHLKKTTPKSPRPPSRGEFVRHGIAILNPPLRGAQGGVDGFSFTKNIFVKQQLYNIPQTPENSNSPNKRGAFLKSLVIPGWGQYSLGAKASGRNFVISEILLIGASVGFKVYSNWLQDDFTAFAAQHAAISNIESKNDQFWVDVGNFNSVIDFNDEKLRQRNTRDVRATDGDEFWQWDSEANRASFEDLRIKKDRAAERSSFMLAGIVANHVISAIHALWVGKKMRNATASQTGIYRLAWENAKSSRGGKIRLSYKF